MNFRISLLPHQILYLNILVLGFLSFLGLNLFNPSILFEALLFVTFFIYLSTIQKDVLWIPIVSLTYVTLSLIYAVIIEKNHILDFFLIFKSFVYLVIISQFVGKNSLTPEYVRKIYLVVLGLFFLKYLFLVLQGTARQSIRVFDESNFELMMLSCLFLLDYRNRRELNYLEIMLLLITFFLSGSRSGLVIIVFLIGALFLKNLNKRNFFILLLFAPIGIGMIYFIFLTRSEGDTLESIDRYIFFMSFLKEVKDWTFFDFLVGSERITALSPETCGKLNYYEKLLSFRNDGTCYSVILHSFIIRVIFDHGLIGFSFLCLSVYHLVRKSGTDRFISFLILMILILNSLSVSAFNSVYAMLGVSLFLTSKNPEIIVKNDK
ncbi:hypothetical protein D0X99_19315 [Algoriphagus lacus]|uniref:O-antigen ligase domain-containing protein n=1 Tax=Algoriphagus lacus TaxID=2056311 RepID=A0A418PLY0_9BACT|nr:hypothetical protein D0X99_19315 [Algoriphagus lacus]